MLYGLEATPRVSPEETALARHVLQELQTATDELEEDFYDAEDEEEEALAEEKLQKLYRSLHALLSAPEEYRPTIAAAILIRHTRKRTLRSSLFTKRLQDRYLKLAYNIGKEDFPYPNANIELRAKVALGYSPVELARGYLTKREAHEWLSSVLCQDHPATWFAYEKLDLPEDFLPHTLSYIGVEVFRWFVGAWKDKKRKNALLRDRVQLGPGGHAIHGAYIDRLDELEPEDLVKSVDRTFQNAMERIAKEMNEGYEPGDLLLEVPPWWPAGPHATLLQTPRMLFEEGRAMEHCAGQYTGRVAQGESIVVAIHPTNRQGVVLCRATLELDPQDGGIRQLFGAGNTSPGQECRVIAENLSLRFQEWLTGGPG